MQPTWIPPNVQFIVDDAEDTWHYRQCFDLIHATMMVGSFLDWPRFLSKAYTWTRPDGFLELQDVDSLACDDNTFAMDPPSCPLAQWWSLVCKAFDTTGRPMTAAPSHRERMLKAGYVGVQETMYKWPINTWPKDERTKKIGMYSRENTLEALEALALAPLTRFLGWSTEEVQVLVAGARKDIRDTGIHAYWNMWVQFLLISLRLVLPLMMHQL